MQHICQSAFLFSLTLKDDSESRRGFAVYLHPVQTGSDLKRAIENKVGQICFQNHQRGALSTNKNSSSISDDETLFHQSLVSSGEI